jgi:nitrate reductase molybdenum cofactor assembly chaperone
MLYDDLARLLEYPVAKKPECLPEFAGRIRNLSLEQLQEVYVQTFELNPVCSLEIGWHLFGENYERGEFLVKMRQEIRRHGLVESTELPDHLTHVLPVVARMQEEEAAEFVGAFLLPALEKMRTGIAGKNNPYELVLDAVDEVLRTYHSQPLLENVK